MQSSSKIVPETPHSQTNNLLTTIEDEDNVFLYPQITEDRFLKQQNQQENTLENKETERNNENEQNLDEELSKFNISNHQIDTQNQEIDQLDFDINNMNIEKLTDQKEIKKQSSQYHISEQIKGGDDDKQSEKNSQKSEGKLKRSSTIRIGKTKTKFNFIDILSDTGNSDTRKKMFNTDSALITADNSQPLTSRPIKSEQLGISKANNFFGSQEISNSPVIKESNSQQDLPAFLNGLIKEETSQEFQEQKIIQEKLQKQQTSHSKQTSKELMEELKDIIQPLDNPKKFSIKSQAAKEPKIQILDQDGSEKKINSNNNLNSEQPPKKKKFSFIKRIARERRDTLEQNQNTNQKNSIFLTPSNPQQQQGDNQKKSVMLNRQSLLQSFMQTSNTTNKGNNFLSKIISEMHSEDTPTLRKDQQSQKSIKAGSSKHLRQNCIDETVMTRKQKIKKKFFKKIERVDRVQGYQIIYPPFILPLKSKAKLIYDFYIMLPIIWVCLSLPWEMAFPDDKNQIISILILIIFILDLIINFRTTFYNEAFEEIVDSKQVAINYMKSRYFLIDLISALPYDLIGKGENSSFFHLLQLFKIFRLFRLGKLFQLISTNDNFSSINEIAKLVLGFLLLLHWFALLWYALADYHTPSQDERNWNNVWLPSNYRIIADSSDIQEDTLLEQFYRNDVDKFKIYIYTYYSMLMVILGGEVSPVNTSQGIIVTCMVFIGQMTIATIFANMGVQLQKAYRKKDEYEKIQNQNEQYMKQNNVPQNIQDKVQEYQDFCWRKNLMFDKDLTDFSDVSLTLRRDLLVFIHQKVILNVPLFSELEQYEVLSIIQKLKPQVYMPGDKILKMNEIITEMYFIDEGIIELSQQLYKKHKLEHHNFMLQTGDHFGEMAILTHWNSDIEVQSLTFTILQTFSRKDYESIIKQYPDIEKRLKQGFKVYKREDKERQVDKMLNNDLFKDLSREELGELYVNYLHDQFVDPETVLIIPRQPMNAIYFILKGSVAIHREVKKSDDVYIIQDNGFHELSVDDQVFELINNKGCLGLYESIENEIEEVGKLGPGKFFGLCPLKESELKTENENLYVVSETTCHLGVLTYNILRQLKIDNYEIYKQISKNIRKLNSPLNNLKIKRPASTVSILESDSSSNEESKDNTRSLSSFASLQKESSSFLKSQSHLSSDHNLFFQLIEDHHITKQSMSKIETSQYNMVFNAKLESYVQNLNLALSQVNSFSSKFQRVGNNQLNPKTFNNLGQLYNN